jgi:hypothetical protein
VRLAGIDVRDTHALGLAMLLRQNGYANTGELIQTPVVNYEPDVALTIKDREAILSVLIEANAGLAQLRAVLHLRLRPKSTPLRETQPSRSLRASFLAVGCLPEIACRVVVPPRHNRQFWLMMAGISRPPIQALVPFEFRNSCPEPRNAGRNPRIVGGFRSWGYRSRNVIRPRVRS